MSSEAIIGAVNSVTKKWAKQRKAEERDRNKILNRAHMWSYSRITRKEVAWQHMEVAYLKASANGTLPAHARQIMYAARGHIQRKSDRPLGKKFDQYFSQTLLPAYMAGLAVGYWKSVDELAAIWKVDRRFEPQLSEREAAGLHGQWQEAVQRCKSWAREDGP